MKLPIVDEKKIAEMNLPGRDLRWVISSETSPARHCSMAVIEVQPGQTVKPAHSHPNGEEIIYLLSGTGRVWIEGVVEPVHAGCAMLQNSGSDVMKVACFFAPATSLDNYKFFENIEFPA
jgi:quercetin dioxygenase-like cupin family protein